MGDHSINFVKPWAWIVERGRTVLENQGYDPIEGRNGMGVGE